MLALCCSTNEIKPSFISKYKIWYDIAPMLFNQRNNFFQSVCWSNISLTLFLAPHKITVSLFNFHIAHVDVGPTLSNQRQLSANDSALCQRTCSRAGWVPSTFSCKVHLNQSLGPSNHELRTVFCGFYPNVCEIVNLRFTTCDIFAND